MRQQGSASWLLIVTLSGSGRFGHADGEFFSHPGDAVLLQPRRHHEYGFAPEAPQDVWEFSWAHFHIRPHWESFLAWPSLGPGMRHVHLAPETLETVTTLLDETIVQARQGQTFADALAMNLLERTLLTIAQSAVIPTKPTLDARVARVVSHLQENLQEPVEIESLAKVAGLSPSRFAHLFTKETGISPRLFAERLKIDRARQLLELTDLPIRAVAQSLGFVDELYFSKRFKRLAGQPPSLFRRIIRRERKG